MRQIQDRRQAPGRTAEPCSGYERHFRSIPCIGSGMRWQGDLAADYPHRSASCRTDSDTIETLGEPATEPHAGRVYFITSVEGGPFKVGWSKDPRQRLSQLQAGQWVELKIYGCIPGQPQLEREIQKELLFAAIRGEWFKRASVLQWIEAWEQSPDTWGALGYPVLAEEDTDDANLLALVKQEQEAARPR